MSKKAAEIEDVLEVVNDLAVMMGDGFGVLDEFRAETNQRLTSLEKGQTEANGRLTKIVGTLEAIQADIKELYKMVSSLRKEMNSQKMSISKLEKRISDVEAFAILVSRQTGIQFK